VSAFSISKEKIIHWAKSVVDEIDIETDFYIEQGKWKLFVFIRNPRLKEFC